VYVRPADATPPLSPSDNLENGRIPPTVRGTI
jgi:hypothetical protein